MKILFIRDDNPYFGSSASNNRYAGLLDALMQRGASVAVVVTGGYRERREYILKGRPPGRPNLEVKYLLPIFNHNIWLRRLNGYVLSGIWRLLVHSRLAKVFASDYDVIWLTCDTSILDALCVYESSLKGLSLIELSEFNDLYKLDGQTTNKLQYWLADKENRAFLESVSKIDLLAVMTKTLIRHYGPMAKPDAKLLHLPMTVDLKRFSVGSSNGVVHKRPYIVYIGVLNNQKDGVDILIRAFGEIAAKYPEYTLYLTGFYHHDVPMQRQLISDLNLNDRIVYPGVMEKTDIPSFIQNAELLVMARPDSRQARGGFPTKLGEYLSTGNPVCVTRVGEIPDYLEDNISAFLADPGSVESFASAMDRALSDSENAKRVGANGRKVAEKHFSTDVQGERLMAFLEENCSKDKITNS